MKIALIQQQYTNKLNLMVTNTSNMIKNASKSGAKLIILEELHTTNYFCQSENSDNFKKADNFDRNKEIFSSLAKKYNVVIVTSLFEKRTNGIYHNTSVVFENDGKEAGYYRKMHIPDDPGFYEKFYFTPGDGDFLPIKTSLGNLGVMICWDQWFPESARLMSLAGADILIYPTAIGWDENDTQEEKDKQLNSWKIIQQSHAIANAIPVVAVNRVGFEKDESAVLNGINFWGNSFVAGTSGEIIASAKTLHDEIIYAEVDFAQTKTTRELWPFLRDRRIDKYDELTKIYRD